MSKEYIVIIRHLSEAEAKLINSMIETMATYNEFDDAPFVYTAVLTVENEVLISC